MKWGFRGALVWLAIALVAGVSAAPAGAVRLGAAPRVLAYAADAGALDPGTPIHFAVTLKPRTGLAAFVRQVSDPGSPLYRDYLTPAAFGQRFGATPDQLAAVEASLRAHGLRPGRVAANRLSISLAADAGAVERAFSLSLRRVRLRSGRMAVVPNAAPAIDPGIAPEVQAIVGLSSAGAPRPLAAGPRSLPGGSPGARRGRLTGHVATGGPQACSAASSTASANGAYTADQLAFTYQLSGLYGAGNQGQGQTIALLELEPNDPGDISTYQSCYGTSAPVSYIRVDGGAGSGAGSGEAALDIEVAIGLAPKATVLVYQGPNGGSGGPGSGPYDTYSQIINQDRAQVISTSWGACEPDTGAAAANAESTLFQQAAAEGQTVFAASGDTGAEDCLADTPPNPAPAVDDPGSQPYVTSVGGTTLSGLGPRTETVWNGGGNLVAAAGLSSGASGGGVSQIWKMPAYQSRAAGSLNLVQPASSAPPCNTGALCRQVPDVSADADPATGYVIYLNGSGGDPTSPSGWQVAGGTSAAAPLWAALVALVNRSPACHGSPIGFANPTLYGVAGTAYGSNFDDITSGNNDFTGTNGGLYPARTGYDMATGLGTPNATALASALCSGAFRVTSPGAQATRLGQTVSLRISTSGPHPGISYSASGLPPGLSLSRSSGRITGQARKAGRYTVTVTATNQDAAIGRTVFAWAITGRPSVSGVRLSGLAGSHPRLQLTVKAARGTPALRTVAVDAPAGLRFVPGRGRVSVGGAGGRRVAFKLRKRAGSLQVVLTRPQSKVGLTVSSGAIAAASGLAAQVRGRRPVSITLRLIVTDARGLHTPLRLRVKLRR